MREAAAWLDAQTPGLSSKLAADAATTLQKIAESPAAYRALRGNLRRAFLSRFNYTVVFLYEADRISVLGMVHGARDFERWLQTRLSS
ncbi:MAG: hypothetical protein IT462_17885 [Planctomycetes bacterium]|nr:hypothetical protein [Planctomycetota bacterium]